MTPKRTTVVRDADLAATSWPHLLPWYAVRVRSNFEKHVFADLCAKGYAAYLPLYSKRNRWSDRVKTVELPLFPGYVFCRVDVNQRVPLLNTAGVVGLVTFGKSFVPIPEPEIEAVQAVLRSGLASMPWPFLQAGERVRIAQGALNGVEGLLIQNKSEYRVVVSVDLLQRSIAVEVDREWVQPLSRASASFDLSTVGAAARGSHNPYVTQCTSR